MQSFTLRRQLLLAGLLGCTLLLGACDRNAPPSFHGNDVTGATFGKDSASPTLTARSAPWLISAAR